MASTVIQTGQIILQLECLFENSPKLCIKQNQSGWGGNQRIVGVKDKKLYYAKIFTQFQQGKTTDISDKYIKAYVNLEDIYEINYHPVSKRQKKTMILIFPQSKVNQNNFSQLNETKDINSTNKPKINASIEKPNNIVNSIIQNTTEQRKMIKWKFDFTYDIREKLQQLRDIQKQLERQKNALKNDDQIQERDQLQNFQLRFNDQPINTVNQKLTFQYNQQQVGLEQYVSQIQKAKQFIKLKQNRQKQQKNQRRKNKQRQTATYTSFSPIQSQQSFPIQSHWRQYFLSLQQLHQQKNPQKSIFQYQLVVYKQIHHFKQTCSGLFKNYIHQKINGIHNQRYQFGGWFFFKGIWIKIGDNQINQLFMMYYYAADISNIFNKIHKILYRVPDICMVEYLGFKALCMCDLPFSDLQKSQVYNLNNDSLDMHITLKVKQHMAFFQKAFNIKVEDFLKDKKKLAAPLGHNLRIFEYNFKKDLKSDQVLLNNFYYFFNLQNLFPLDFNFQVQSHRSQCRLRPQLLNQVRNILQMDDQEDPRVLSSCFMSSVSLSQQQKTKQDDKSVKSSQFIRKCQIPQLVDKLNNSQIIFVDSYSIKMYMSQFGINIRYLGEIHQLARLTYLREIIQVQCISRRVKRIFITNLKEQLQTQYKHKIVNTKPRLQNLDANGQPIEQLVKIKDDQRKIVQITLDFLNLVFGKGAQTQMFWEIIQQQVQSYFKIQIKLPFNGNPGSLLHAVLYNCGIQAFFDINIPLFRSSTPFSLNNDISIRIKTKIFDFPSFQIQKLIKNYPHIEKTLQNKQMFQKIAQKIFKMDLLKNYYLFENQFMYQTSFSKLNLIKQGSKKPSYINSSHPSQICYFISNKSQINFQRGLNLLQFTFSDYHPLYISFYQQYSSFFQPQLLKKTSILQSIKCYGEFHSKTSELYSKFYSQGYKQFYQKSLRSNDISSGRMNVKSLFQKKKYLSCMDYSMKQLKASVEQPHRIHNQNANDYVEMLLMGMKAAQRIRHLDQSLKIASEISEKLNAFKIRNHDHHYQLILQILKIKLIRVPKKMFLYKLVLLCITLQKRYKQKLQFTKQGTLRPANGQLKQQLSSGIMNEYFIRQTHQRWIDFILKHLLESAMYFNHLEDLFNNTQYHIQRYDNEFFKQSLGYWDILVKLFGEELFKIYLYETGYN